jgi:hypothetical protein
MARDLMSQGIVDLFSPTYELYQYVFVSAGGSNITISGWFQDFNGNPVGNPSYTGTVGATPVTLATALGLSALPANAAGFVGQISGTLSWCAQGAADGVTIPTAVTTDMQSNTGFYPQMPTTTDFHLGRA